jgi:TetR/AcrR family transcriptional regulator, transcriptional repressor for nem operon
VLKKAGVPKGSFYHYFPSKEDFGLAVIDSFAADYERKLHRILDDSSGEPLQRITNYLEEGILGLTEQRCKKGCLIGNLGQELADQNERFRERIEGIFAVWRNRFAACLKEAQDRNELSAEVNAVAMADFILSGWEGALLMAKVLKTPEPLRIFRETLFETILV